MTKPGNCLDHAQRGTTNFAPCGITEEVERAGNFTQP
jgi:hypothetical protein